MNSMTKQTNEELLSVMQAAALIGVDRTVISRAIRQERLPARQVGRGYIIRRADFEAWYTENPPQKRRKRKSKGV